MQTNSNNVKVMVVDDSAVIRGMVTRILKNEDGIEVVASVANGKKAVEVISNEDIDVVVLDIEMPVMDGITALPLLLEASPKSKIIMSSALTLDGADVTLRALSLGATDYIAKPSSRENLDSVKNFYRELTEKIKILGGETYRQALKEAEKEEKTKQDAPTTSRTIRKIKRLDKNIAKKHDLNKLEEIANSKITYPTFPPKALAIASSTGGPQALAELMKGLKNKLKHIPIFITQHMPPSFTTILAKNLGEISGRECVEAEDGMKVKAGTLYLAPGDYHMLLEKQDDGCIIVKLTQTAQINFCRPAADPMVDSLIDIYGKDLLMLVMTGMGSDGMRSAKRLRECGGFVVAQGRESCTVWGMPKSIVENNIQNVEIELNEMADYLIKAFGR